MNTTTTNTYIQSNTAVPGINCDIIDYVQRYSPVIYKQISQCILSFLSIFFVISARIIQRHAYFHPNIKVLLKLYHLSIVLFGFSMGAAQLYHLLTSLSLDNCELLISCRLCFLFRYLITSSIIMFCLSIVSILIERSIATNNLSKGYENKKSIIGSLLGFISIIISLLFSFVYHYTDIIRNRTCIHCVYDKMDIIPNYIITIFSVISCISFVYNIFLLIYNRYQLSKKTYSLSIEFQINQNLRVLHMLLPLSFLTAVVFTWYTVSGYLLDLSDDEPEQQMYNRMFQNAFPIYIVLSSLIWLIMLFTEKRKKKISGTKMIGLGMRKDEKDVYFQSLNDQWSRHTTPRPYKLQLFNVFTVPRGSVTA